MKSYKQFVNTQSVEEESIAFSYKDGGIEQYVLISGSPSEIKNVQKKLDKSAKSVIPAYAESMDDVLRISASEWLKIK